MGHEVLIMDILSKLVIAGIKDITILAGYHDESVCRKKIKELIGAGLVNKQPSGNGTLMYFLSKKGLSELGINRRPFEYRNQNTNHELMVGKAASYMYIVHGLSIYDMEFDRSQRSSADNTNIPDILYAGGKRAVEIELTLKEKNRLEEKFLNVTQSYDLVRWIYPEERPSINARLTQLVDDYSINPKRCKILTLQYVCAKVDSYDLKTNNPRFDRRYQ